MGNETISLRPHHLRLIYLREFAGYRGDGAVGALTNDYGNEAFARKILGVLENCSTGSSDIVFIEGIDDICAGRGLQCPRMTEDCKSPHGSVALDDRKYIQNLGLEVNRPYSYKDILKMLGTKDVSFILEEIG